VDLQRLKVGTMALFAASAPHTAATGPDDVKVQHTRLFIGGAFVDARSGKRFASVNPATGKIIAEVHEAGEADVDAAVRAAHAAFQPGSPWRALEPHERGLLLLKLADLIDRDKQYIADLEALDNGKPAKMALWVDCATASRLLRYYAGWPDKITGETPTVR